MEAMKASESAPHLAALVNGLSTPAMQLESLENGKIKTRKPYTITKTRERWSEEEHLRFVEALRLHGRAWRKIEEHIGTKTAVQIRSHAQKFFNKLEKKKEAGETPDKEEDIAIPPPRPKRKPAKLYPRKDGASTSGFTGTSQLQQLPSQQQLPGVLGMPPSQHLGVLGNTGSSEVTDATVAAVTAAASAAAAAAAAAVVAAAGQEVQTHMQVHPPSCFPFFGMPPSALAHITPAGVSALDQAALLTMQHNVAAAKAAAAMGLVNGGDGALAAAAAAAEVMGDAGGCAILGDNGGSDRNLVEATGTTDGTHILANTQLRGSDGDSACSRETDNQDTCPSLAMDFSWQSKLPHQGQPQLHDMGSTSPSAANRSLQAGGFDPSQLQWGTSRCYNSAAAELNAAQTLQQMLCSPLYLAAAERHMLGHSGGQTAAQAVAAAELAGAAAAAASLDNVRCSGGGPAGGGSVRSKSRRTAPSVNSGSTGPPAGSKRGLEVVSAEAPPPAKKAAREASDIKEEVLEVPPSSPSIQEKELKAASQPSNTNGNNSGSNESNDGSKRRPGTAQAEGSNPTHYSSGNGYSVKDSTNGTNGHTNGNGHSCGNGISAFNHHHHHHHSSHTQPPSSRRGNNYSSNQQQGSGGGHARHTGRMNHYSHTGGTTTPAEGGTSGTATITGLSNRDRDEGRSSSDLEGPAQEQLQQQLPCEDEAMEQEQEQEEQQQVSESAAQLQSLMASLQGMVGNPLMLQQAYGAAAAAAATAQQIVASAMQQQHQQHQQQRQQHQQQHQQHQQHLGILDAAQQHWSAMQHMSQRQQQQQSSAGAPPMTQGFAPWHAPAAAASGFGSADSFVSSSLPHASSAGGQLTQQQQAQQLAAAAAGLVGLGSGWSGASVAASSSSASGLYAYAQLAAQQQHHHHHHHHHPTAQRGNGSGSGSSASAAAAAAVAASLQHLQQGLGLGRYSGLNGNSSHALALGAAAVGLNGVEALTQAASGVALAGNGAKRTASQQ